MAQKPPPQNPSYPTPPAYQLQAGYQPTPGYPQPAAPGYHTQPGYQPPPQGYAVPSHAQPARPQMYMYPQTTHQTSSLGGLFKSAEKAVGSAAKTVQHEVDRYANSPTIRMFLNGTVVRLQSRETGHYLKVLNTGALVANGSPQDTSAHFAVVNCGSNIVILRSAIYPTCHIANHETNIVGNGNGDGSCRFRLHETMAGFVTFESLMKNNHHIGVDSHGNMKPTHLVGKDNSAMFSPSIVYSPYAVV